MKKISLTISDSVDLIYETLVGELRGQRGQQVDVAVKQEQSIEHRKDLILAAGKLPLHSQHHVGHVLNINR